MDNTKLERAEERLRNSRYWEKFYAERNDMVAVFKIRCDIAETEKEIAELKGAC